MDLALCGRGTRPGGGVAAWVSAQPGNVGRATCGASARFTGVIAPDLRGFGDSPVPEGVYTMDAMADDVVELLETLEIAGRSSWAGCRWGVTWRSRWWHVTRRASRP